MLDGLVSGAVFTLTDGVVGVHKHVAQFHQCGHTHGVTGVVHKHQEGAAVVDKTTVGSDTVHNGRHAELTHAVENIVAVGIFGSDGLGARPHGQVGAGQVSREIGRASCRERV